MFNNDSRYKKTEVVTETDAQGKTVSAIKLRRLPKVKGADVMVKGNTRLDLLSKEIYNNPSRFWHIADANTELEATELVRKPGRIIQAPGR